MSEPREWRLEIDWAGRPVSANEWMGLHWAPKSKLVEEWNGHAIMAARIARLPKGLPGFEAEIQFRYNGNALTDPDAAAPTWKAACDGLVRHGLTPDDTAEFFHGVKLLPPYVDKSQPDAVIIVIREVIGREPVRL